MKANERILVLARRMRLDSHLWKYAIAIVLWVVIIAVVIVFVWDKPPAQIWQNLRGFISKQIAGEKDTQDEATDAAKLSQTPTPMPTASATSVQNTAKALTGDATPTPLANDNSSVQKNPEPPDLLDYYGDKLANLRALAPAQQLNLSRGSIKFKFTYDGGDDDRVLFLGNFNGQDRKNVLAIVFASCTVGFDTYDKAGQEGEDDPNIELGDECQGKNFDLEFRWDFTAQPAVKRIYVGQELKRESFPKTVPSEVNSQNLIGPIAGLEIR